MDRTEKREDAIATKINLSAALAGAAAATVYGWFEGYHGEVDGLRGAVAGFGYGFIGAGFVTACVTSGKDLRASIGSAAGGLRECFRLHVDEPMARPKAYEGPADRAVDALLEIVRVDPAHE